MGTYREVLRLPGVARLMWVGLLIRLPVIALGTVLTLHVLLTLHRSYAAAGLVATVLTVSMAVSAPWRGRAVDRLGLRRALLPCIVLGTAAWLIAPWMGYGGLLVVSVLGGLFSVPIFSVVRQSFSVLAPPEQRRTVLTLDSISVELSFMVGPAAAVVAATVFPTKAVLVVLALALLASGGGLWLLDPPVRSPAERGAEATSQREPAGRRREWFTPRLGLVLAATVGATLVLAGTDVAVVAALRELHHLRLTGLIFLCWGIASIAGGLAYGAAHREISPMPLLVGLGLLTVPLGLANSVALLCVLIMVAGLFCAPTLTATASAVSGLVPEASRGEAMGWHGSALTIGSAVGAPLSGWAIDRVGAWGGFGAVGLAGAVVGCLGVLAGLRLRRSARNITAPASADTLVN